jgi:dienelactone hydrolase
MSSCCPPGSIGPAPLAKKTPQGQVRVLSSSSSTASSTNTPISAYVVGPHQESSASCPTRIVVVFPDVYGIDSGNQKIVCDALSDDSTLVIMPDLFRGNPIVKDWGMFTSALMIPALVWASKTRMTDTAIEQDLMESLLPFLKNYDQAKVSMLGFCYGGWVMGRALALDAFSFVKCGVGIHPSWKLQALHGKTEVALAEAVKAKPILFLPAGNDDLKVGTPIVQQLAKQRGGIAEATIAIEFPDMVHGWVARGDANDAKIAEQQEKALNLAKDFIKAEEAK